jgi:hypothetical protein
MTDYKKRFLAMPKELQEITPRPELDAAGDFASVRAPPKLVVRGPSEGETGYIAPSPTLKVLNAKDSRRSSESGSVILTPVVSNPAPAVAPWEQGKETIYEPRTPTTGTNTPLGSVNSGPYGAPHSPEAANQPFRSEVQSCS